jgi:hypothetical protein
VSDDERRGWLKAAAIDRAAREALGLALARVQEDLARVERENRELRATVERYRAVAVR